MRGRRGMVMMPMRKRSSVGRPMVIVARPSPRRPIGMPRPRRAPYGRRPY